MSSMSSSFKSLFAIDTRALACLRIGLALFLLYDYIFFREIFSSDTGSSLHQLVVYIASLLMLPTACLLLVGWQTGLVKLVCWGCSVLVIGFDLLNGRFVNLAEYVVHLLLFWTLFLPVHYHCSIDNRGKNLPPSNYFSMGTVGILLQVAVIYFVAGITKNYIEWVEQANGLSLVLANAKYGTELGVWLTQFPDLLKLASRATVLLETVGTLLLFIPGVGLPFLRFGLVLFFWSMHICMALTMQLSFFPYVCLLLWSLFLPSHFWKICDQRECVTQGQFAPEHILNVLAGLAIIYMLVSASLAYLYFPDYTGPVLLVQQAGKVLGLYQQWFMFSLPSSL